MKIIFYILLFICLNVFLFSQPSFPGFGTELDPYQIWNTTHWDELKDSTYSNDALHSFWLNKHFRLMQDIDNVTVGLGYWLGDFHGNRKKITVNIEVLNPKLESPALFIALYGTIDSLTVDGYITNASGGYGSGMIINMYSNSYGRSAVISNCINNATITNPNPAKGYGSGGIASSNSGTIINCINNGDITGVDNVGGIAGDNQTGTIINCINTGKITATNSGSAPNGCSGVGGIAAYHKNNISNCINLGTVEGQNNVGGIVGWASPLGNNASQITNCVNYGYVKGINNVGGIIGYMYNQNVNISNCVNAGVVEGESDVGSITGKE